MARVTVIINMKDGSCAELRTSVDGAKDVVQQIEKCLETNSGHVQIREPKAVHMIPGRDIKNVRVMW